MVCYHEAGDCWERWKEGFKEEVEVGWIRSGKVREEMSSAMYRSD